jgi:hypothetical protein
MASSMSDLLVLRGVSVQCQDGVSRESCSVVLRSSEYVFLDAEGSVLDGDRRVVEITACRVLMSPERLSMLVAKHGPVLS